MVKAVYPGSFDPPTFGHLDIIERGAALFENLTVLVADNAGKKNIFTAAERVELLKTLLDRLPEKQAGRLKSGGNSAVYVDGCDTLVTEYMRKKDITVLIRGVRNSNDFIYENDMAYWNRALGGVETVLLFPRPEYAHVSSTAARELSAFGKDTSGLLPPAVSAALARKRAAARSEGAAAGCSEGAAAGCSKGAAL